MEERQPIKYVREIEEYFDEYVKALIEEIYIGTGIALGLSEETAYKIAEKDPKNLEKAGFFSSIFKRLKSIFPRSIPKFRVKKLKKIDANNPMTPDEWDTFNRAIDEYWRKAANEMVSDVSAKTFLLGKKTADFRYKKKPYQNKSLYQVVTDQFDGAMPESIEDAYKKYDFKDSEKRILNRSFSDTAMYVTEANSNLKDAIRQIVTQGIEDGKSGTEIASDMYWGIEKDDDAMNKYRADSVKRNWSRVAKTEMSTIHEAGIMAAGESDAMESMVDPSKARYYVRTGGTCEWCRSKQGILVRQIPVEVASGIEGESLRSVGIKDPNTNIAIWAGKNNVGRKQADWLIACPAHPYNVATFSPIDIESEFYNEKTGDVERRQKKSKYLPQIEQVERPKDFREPKKIGDNLVRVGNNVYESVRQDEFNRKLEEFRKDKSRPIPVNINSPQYTRIFGSAT